MSNKVNSPMMKQYFDIKSKHPDAILLFRVGDFYEMYGKDAIVGAEILGIVQTRTADGVTQYIEMAGFPHHALDTLLRQSSDLVSSISTGSTCQDTGREVGTSHQQRVVLFTLFQVARTKYPIPYATPLPNQKKQDTAQEFEIYCLTLPVNQTGYGKNKGENKKRLS